MIVITAMLASFTLFRAPTHAAVNARATRYVMQAEETETLTLTLKGCLDNGVGLGLDEKNRIDLLKPDSAASKVCAMGDEVLTWNGEALLEVVAGRMEQKKLKDVVQRQDSHTIVVRRVRKAWSSNYDSTSSSWSSDWSSSTGQSSWGGAGGAGGDEWSGGPEPPTPLR